MLNESGNHNHFAASGLPLWGPPDSLMGSCWLRFLETDMSDVTSYYYLHTNGDLIFEKFRPEPDSDFVRWQDEHLRMKKKITSQELCDIQDKEPGEVIDAEFVRCSEIDHAGQCLDAQGHDGPHMFERESDGPDWSRCQFHCEIVGAFYGMRCTRRLDHHGSHQYQPLIKEKDDDDQD